MSYVACSDRNKPDLNVFRQDKFETAGSKVIYFFISNSRNNEQISFLTDLFCFFLNYEYIACKSCACWLAYLYIVIKFKIFTKIFNCVFNLFISVSYSLILSEIFYHFKVILPKDETCFQG